MGFLDSTLDINLVTPLNQLGYGIAGLNIMDSLTKAGHTVSLSLLGQSQVPHRYADSFKASHACKDVTVGNSLALLENENGGG